MRAGRKMPHKKCSLPSHSHNTNIIRLIRGPRAIEITQHPFDTKARETKLNCLNTFGHSKTTTNLLPSSGESLSSADLITTLATNVIYAFLRNS